MGLVTRPSKIWERAKMTGFMVCKFICGSRMWLGPIMANAFVTDFVSMPNLLTTTDVLTHPHCPILVMNVESSCSVSLKKDSFFEPDMKVLNLALSVRKKALSLTVLREGMEEDAKLSLSRESAPAWLRPSRKTSFGGPPVSGMSGRSWSDVGVAMAENSLFSSMHKRFS